MSQTTSTEDLKNLFVATVSHQLRTPLSVVKWVLSVIESDPELQAKENILQLVKQAGAGVDRMVDTVNDLINVVRIEEGKLPVTFLEGTIGETFAKVIARVTPIAESMSLSLEVDQDEIEPFQFDAILMGELLENLLTNALDYAEKGTAIKLSVKDSGDSVEVKVSNEGPGLSKEEQKSLFKPFFRGEHALIAHPDGSGLGLYICRSIAEAHEGDISFESDPGKLTTVTVRIPKKKA